MLEFLYIEHGLSEKNSRKIKYCCNRVMLIFLICTFHTVLYCQVSIMLWSYNAAYASSLRFAFQNRSLRCVFHVVATSSLMVNNKDVVKRYVVFASLLRLNNCCGHSAFCGYSKH